MKTVALGGFAVEQGTRLMFSDFANDGVMWTGEGPRQSRHVITFRNRFAEDPVVIVGISMWDLGQMANARADLRAEHVTPTDFHLVFRTWGDTRVARIRADWTAMGVLADEEDWQLT